MKGVGAGIQESAGTGTGGQKEVWCVALCCWYDSGEEVRTHGERQREGRVCSQSSIRVSLRGEKQKVWKKQEGQAKPLACRQQNWEAEPTCTLCVDVDSNGDFRHIPQRCLSLQLILVKNMRRHARSGTSLQLWHCGPGMPKRALLGHLEMLSYTCAAVRAVRRSATSLFFNTALNLGSGHGLPVGSV